MTLHLRATGRYLPYGITQCYLPPDTSERAPLNIRNAHKDQSSLDSSVIFYCKTQSEVLLTQWCTRAWDLLSCSCNL